MLKRDELADATSCFNKAQDEERLFVLCARDPAAPAVIRAWIAERLRLGKNGPGDEQIREAYECANLMELERSGIVASPTTFTISRFRSQSDWAALQATFSWRDFVAYLATPRLSPCSRETCSRTACLHKWGVSWSPAVYVGEDRRQGAYAVSLLVFDVDQVTDDQWDVFRGRIGGLQYLVHSTHSDRPDSRCLRLVFPLSRPVLTAAWAFFWKRAQRELVPETDPDPVGVDMGRMYFLPSCPKDASYFIQVNAGSVLDVDAMMTAASSSQEVILPKPCVERQAAP